MLVLMTVAEWQICTILVRQQDVAMTNAAVEGGPLAAGNTCSGGAGGNTGGEDGCSGDGNQDTVDCSDWGWWGATEARAALQQLAVLPHSARERATHPWVNNHYRWIVWKLASYERR